MGFQSTLPAWGSDRVKIVPIDQHRSFNPRSPRGGATRRSNLVRAGNTVSIHAPRVGERLREFTAAQWPAEFQSTLPAWGSDHSPDA